jgi:serine/threonine-protein kinase ULK/ATG1
MKKVSHYVFDKNDLLGEGKSGKVYKGYCEESNSVVAIKVIPQEISNDKEAFERLNREVAVLLSFKSSYTLSMIGVERTVNNFYIITQFCNGGTLEAQLKDKTQTFSETEALKIIKQIAKAFDELEDLDLKDQHGHKLVIMHRDLKPANIQSQPHLQVHGERPGHLLRTI